MYLVYEIMYGELLYECGATNIVGLYNTKELAQEKVKQMVERYLSEDDWVLDEEDDWVLDENIFKITTSGTYLNNSVRLFWKEQENWSCYFEIEIKEMELTK